MHSLLCLCWCPPPPSPPFLTSRVLLSGLPCDTSSDPYSSPALPPFWAPGSLPLPLLGTDPSYPALGCPSTSVTLLPRPGYLGTRLWKSQGMNTANRGEALRLLTNLVLFKVCSLETKSHRYALLDSVPWSKYFGKSCILYSPLGFPGSSAGKESTCNAGDLGLILELGRSPGRGHGNPLQYSYLENPIDRAAWQATHHGVAKSWTWLSD